MKILEEKYPLGSLKGQKTPGRYVDKILYDNVSVLAKKIVDDMTWLGIFTSSTLEVGTGKSVMAQQVGEMYLAALKEIHGYDIDFTIDNVVFKPEDLIERSFKLPKYSCIILDEWEDTHYWSKLGMSLRQFFRKCRQLNLFMMIIIPNFFQLPPSYAISRSVFLIDVRFSGEFERGYFSFYDFKKKKQLYIHGKKTMDYGCVSPNFTGRFTDGYGVPEEEYRKAKLKDLQDQEGKEINGPTKREIGLGFMKLQLEAGLRLRNVDLSKVFGVTEHTIINWHKEVKENANVNADININNLLEGGEEPKKVEGFEKKEEGLEPRHHAINADDSLKEA